MFTEDQLIFHEGFYWYMKGLEGPALPPPIHHGEQWVKVLLSPLDTPSVASLRAAIDKEWFENGYRIVSIHSNRTPDGNDLWIKRG
jgi:hypothetical protein